MKKSFAKKIICLAFLASVTTTAFSFEDGWTLGLRADFYGTLTMPKISESTLKYMNPMATGMSGVLSGFLMGAEIEVGYIFKASNVFKKLPLDSAFSGIGVYGYIGLGQGNTSQKITATQGESFDIFMIVDFLPVITLGVKGKALFFDNRFSVGLGVGMKVILDMSPSFLVYSTEPTLVSTEIGEIIVTPDMMTKMNPIVFSMRFEMGYAIPILPTTEFALGFFGAFNIYRPKFLTLPPSLEAVAQTNRPGGESGVPLDFDQPFMDYWLNSLDFGVNIGFTVRL